MVEEVAAQADDDGLADGRQTADQACLQDPADRGDTEVDEHDDRQVVLVAGRADPLVDRVPDEQPAPGQARGVADRDEQHQRSEELAALHVLPEAPHAAITSSPKSRANSPSARRSWAGVPDSTIRPSTSTTARSAISMVESRCVATRTVWPSSAGRSRLTSLRSVSVSTAERGSSSTTTRAPVTSARASATRCR